jgi:hypothetical protein
MSKIRPLSQALLGSFFVAALLLAGCNPVPDVSSTPSAPAAPPSTAVPAEMPTPTALPGVTVLVTGAQTDPGQLTAVQSRLSELAQAAGQALETRPDLQPADLQPEWKQVIFLNAPANLQDFLNAAPETRFVSVSQGDLTPTDNLSVIQTRPEYQAFMAGYASVVIANDWRAAGLLPADEPLGGLTAAAYVKGGQYFCGLCNSFYSPIARFPLYSQLPAGSAPDQWLAAADELNLKYVYLYYVSPEAANADMMYTLASRGVFLLGAQTPPDEVRSLYAATIRFNLADALSSLWPTLSSGQPGQSVLAAVEITDINAEILTPGKQMLIEQTLQDLQAGYIYPLDPLVE